MEPIAVIGLSGRFPGACDVSQFWSNLRSGTESITFPSADQVIAAGVPQEVACDSRFVRAAGVVPGFDLFDAPLFGMTPREALLCDPQLRMFFEIAHWAMEDAGYDPYQVPYSVGVFGASGMSSYGFENLRDHRDPAKRGMIATMNNADYLATRISYRFNYRGPSMTVLTACSSSLTAVHLACQSLRLGECDVALAGGVSVQPDSLFGYWYVPGSVSSRDGHCRPFDESAGGTVFCDGAGAVVLKRLADALADGDHVRAVIRGTAINNDGSGKVGFGAPSVFGQIACVQDAMSSAGARPQDISYVEAHGTGTALGDPIEIRALDQAWRGLAGAELAPASCPIGSVKSNIGHLIQAAGVAGLIKLVLALENGEIPPTVNFSSANPKLEIEKSPFFVADTLIPWPRDPAAPRVGAISSLGAGGTNVHLIVAEGPASDPTPPAGRPRVIMWSAMSEPAADAIEYKLAEHFLTHEATFEDTVTTLQRGRHAYPVRRAVVCADAAEASWELSSGAEGRSVIRGEAAPGGRHVAFAFPGQGSLHLRMGLGLYGTEPAFTEAADWCLALFGDRSAHLRRVWTEARDIAELTETSVAQPLLFAIEGALARIWRRWGVEPARVMGHSVGELAAAACAGVFTWADAARLVLLRADAMQSMSAGGMAAVFCPQEKVADLLPETLSLAAVNSPGETVVAGPHEALDAFGETLRGKGLKWKRLQTSHAFHSASMASAAAVFEEGFAGVAMQPPSIPLVSAATGRLLTAEEAVDPAFWAGQLVRPVWFARALATLADLGDHLILEMGPGEVLTAHARSEPRCASGMTTAIPVLPRLSSKGPGQEHRALLGALATTWAQGVSVKWPAVDQDRPNRRIPVPGYQYQRRRYWAAGRTVADEGPPGGTVTSSAGPPEPAEPGAEPVAVSPLSTLSWAEQPRPDPGASRRGASAVVLLPADRSAALSTVVALLQAGMTVHGVRPGPGYAARGSEFEVRQDRPDDMRRVFADLAARGVAADYVVHAAAMELWKPATSRNVLEQLDCSFFSLLNLVREACRATATSRLPRLIVLASRSVDVSGGEQIDLVKSTLHGQVRTIVLEEPRLNARLIDIGPGTPEEELADELGHDMTGEVVALRGTRRWVRREVPYTVRPSETPPIRKNGVYLITGGLGGLGLAVARGLARTGLQPTLALLGRHGLPEGGEPNGPVRAGDLRAQRLTEAIAEMTASGANVRVLEADVADRRQLRRALDVIRAQYGPLNGVLHLSGVPGNGMLLLRKPEQAAEVLRPKVLGTLMLTELLDEQLPPDFFVSFSSRASIGGLAGSGDYAAANAFLDAFAGCGAGGRMLTINWPAWSAVGMAAGPVAASPEQDQVTWDAELSAAASWVLDEHRLNGLAVLPGTAHLDLVLSAFRDRFPAESGATAFEEVVFHAPLVVSGSCLLRVQFTKNANADRAFLVKARQDGHWQVHVSGRIGSAPGTSPRVDTNWLRDRFAAAEAHPLQPLSSHLFTFGPRWETLREERQVDGEKLLAIELPDEFANDLAAHPLHPTVLDAATAGARDAGEGPYLPFMYRRLVVHTDLPAAVHSHIRRRPSPAGNIAADIDLIAPDGRVAAQIEGYVMRRFSGDVLDSVEAGRDGNGIAGVPAPDDAAEPPAPETPAMGTPAVKGIDPERAVRLLLDLLGSRTPRQIVVRPFADGQPVPLDAAVDLPVGRPSVPDSPALQVPAQPLAQRSVGTQANGTGEGAISQMRKIWEDVLGVTGFGNDDEFFAIGGTSLSAIELMTRVRSHFGKELSIAVLLDSPTVSTLTAALQDAQ